MKWGGVFIFCLFSLACCAQPGGPIKYSRLMARLEVSLISSFAYSINQGAIDMDSAAALVCDREGLDRELYYEESYADGAMSPRIRSLLRLGAEYLFRPGIRPVDMD